jgi:hypothetical protein
LQNVCLRPNTTTSEMRKISRENTLVRNFSLVVISTVEKKFAKTQAFDWFRYFVIQNTSIWLASLFPFRNGVETNSTTRRREIFRRETFQNHVPHAFNFFARNFSHFACRNLVPRVFLFAGYVVAWLWGNRIEIVI